MIFEEPVHRLAAAAAEIAKVCDAMEHVEIYERRDVAAAAAVMLEAGRELWTGSATELPAAAVARLRQRISNRAPGDVAAFDTAIGGCDRSLADVSAAVTDHDRRIEPDFVGRPRMDQLRHLSYTGPKLLAKALTASTPAARNKVAIELTLLGTRLLAVVRMPLPAEDPAERGGEVSEPYLARWPALPDLPEGSIIYRPRSQDVVGAVFDREIIAAGSLSSRSHLLRSASNAFVVWPNGSPAFPLAPLGVRVDATSRRSLTELSLMAAEPLYLDAQHVCEWAGKVLTVFDAGWCYKPGTPDGIVALVGESLCRMLVLLRRSIAKNDAHGASVAVGWLGWTPEVSGIGRVR
jgi:hypothetical protein